MPEIIRAGSFHTLLGGTRLPRLEKVLLQVGPVFTNHNLPDAHRAVPEWSAPLFGALSKALPAYVIN